VSGCRNNRATRRSSGSTQASGDGSAGLSAKCKRRPPRRGPNSQPSLTSAIIALERELGGVLFQRRPAITLTVLGHAVHPYFQRIAENADHARDAAGVRPAYGGEQLGRSALFPSA